MQIYLLIFGLGIVIIMTGACNSTQTNSSAGTNSAAESKINKTKSAASSKLVDPAARKCVNDGYILKPVLKNGVPVKHLCINPETGLQCDVWEYFREECSLKKNKK